MGGFKLKNYVNAKCHQSLFLTGVGRSGTTIMGKLIHSMKGVEYAFEPPSVLILFSMIDRMNPYDWQAQLNMYLFEDFYINALAGRRLNFNRGDESYIGLVKASTEIDERISESKRKNRLIEVESDKHQIAFKMPDVGKYMQTFRERYPKVRLVIMQRNAVDTINSLFMKKWYAEDSLRQNVYTATGCEYKGMFIPHWVDQSFYEKWIGMSELDRCGFHYLCNHADIRDNGSINVNYDYFVENPEAVLNIICSKFELEKGEKTAEILASVKKSDKERDMDILKRIAPEITAGIKEIDRKISALTVG